MIRIENHCVCCELPCIYDACPYYRVEVHYCGSCGKACTGEAELCEECAVKEEVE